jgi:DNA-binding MarR family transcriptional regulator
MYQSYLCDRKFQDSAEVANVFRVLRRRCWGDILQTLDAIAYSKQASGKDYHNGWIKIEQSKLADRTGYTRSYLSTQVLELEAIGLLELHREKFECYRYKFTPLAKEIFGALSRVESRKFIEIKSSIRDLLRQLASAFTRFTLAPADRIASFWSQIRESLTGVFDHSPGVVHFLTYKQDPLQDPYQETSTNSTPLTGVCDNPEVFETSFSEQDPEPEPCLNTSSLPLTPIDMTSTNNPSGEEKVPADTTIIPEELRAVPAQPVRVEPSGTARIAMDLTVAYRPDCDLGSTARFDRQIRTYQNVDTLTANLVEIYNRIKPEHWGKCTTIGFHLPRQVASILRWYEDGDLLIQEWGEACLALKANDFYNSPDFKNGNINFLLDPTKTERIPQLAQAWRDRPQVQKEQLAKKMVADVDGIPSWENPDAILTGVKLFVRRKMYKLFITAGSFDHPDCPPVEYLQTHFADLFD